MLTIEKTRTITVLAMTIWLSACSGLSQSLIDDTNNNSLLTGNVPKKWQSKDIAQHLNVRSESSLLRLFNQVELKLLVIQALKNNIDLRNSALRLKIAKLRLSNTKGSALPSAELVLTPQKTEANSTSVSLAFNMSWEADIWGRIANLNQAGSADYQAKLFDFQSAQTSLVARTIQRWNDLQSQQKIIDIVQLQINSLINTENIIKQRYRNGLGTLGDLKTAQAATALRKENMEQRQQIISITRRQINLLLGRTSQHPISSVNYPLEIDVPNLDTPLNVMRKRPDIAAALKRISASDQKYNASQKSLLPTFKLSAGINGNSSSLGDLLSGSTLWSLLGNITAPLYQGGKLKNNIQISLLEREINYLNYQNTLFTAVSEVDNTLEKEYSFAKRQTLLKIAKQHSSQSLLEYRKRYADGFIDILILLSAQQTDFNNQISLIELQRSRLNNRIDLGLALGFSI